MKHGSKRVSCRSTSPRSCSRAQRAWPIWSTVPCGSTTSAVPRGNNKVWMCRRFMSRKSTGAHQDGLMNLPAASSQWPKSSKSLKMQSKQLVQFCLKNIANMQIGNRWTQLDWRYHQNIWIAQNQNLFFPFTSSPCYLFWHWHRTRRTKLYSFLTFRANCSCPS